MRKPAAEPAAEVGDFRVEALRHGSFPATQKHARGVHEHLLGAHLQNHVWVGAHPHPGLPDVAKQRIELRAVETVLNRVHPDEHSIESE